MENDDLGSIDPAPGDMDIINDETEDTKTPPETPGKEDETEGGDDAIPDSGNEETPPETDETGEGNDEPPVETPGEDKNPSFTKIREYDPEFFKKFPEVKIALGRELEYKKLYPTIEEARESRARLDFHTELEESIVGGNSSLLLSRLHQTDEKALDKFAMSFLPTLLKGNPALYEKVGLGVVKNVLNSAAIEAKKTNSKNLSEAVKWIASYVFETEDGSIPSERRESNNDEPSEAEKELRKVIVQKVTDFKEELQEVTENYLENSVKSTIDPRKEIPSILRDALVGKILSDLKEQLGKDTEHYNMMNRLWKDAKRTNFSRQSLSQLKNAYLAGAKKILPVIQKKHVEETLKAMGKRNTPVPDNKTRKIGSTTKENKFAKGFSKDPKKLDPTKTDAELLGE